MDRFVIDGGAPLKGKILAGGSKNCALPVLFATLLAPGKHVVRRVPRLRDMDSALELLIHLGASIEQKRNFDLGSDWTIDSSKIVDKNAPYDIVRKMRASFLCLGPILAREGYVRVSMPGGCAIGARPVDLHLMAFEKLGAEVNQTGGYIEAKLPQGKSRLKGAPVIFPTVSVGATENLIIAATLAQGTTVIENAACEPEVKNLCEALMGMGAKISGQGTNTVVIEGVESLRPMDFQIPPDRIEAATYLIGAHLTGGSVFVQDARAADFGLFLECLERSGAEIELRKEGVGVKGGGKILPVDITTAPFPGFATDIQAQWMALMTQAEGDSMISETIFENRFMHVPELIRMGAQISINGSMVKVKGKPHSLEGAPVMATDLRASASLVLAGLAARGQTNVKRIYHLDRGYESMELKLVKLGAHVERQPE